MKRGVLYIVEVESGIRDADRRVMSDDYYAASHEKKHQPSYSIQV